LAGLYGLLFGFTFTVIQYYLKDFPTWMMKSVLKSVYFVVFIFLSIFSLVLYPIASLLATFPSLEQMCMFLINILLPLLFIVDVLYTILYFRGMLLMLHPEYLAKLVRKELREGRKRDDCINNAYRGFISLLGKYRTDVSITMSVEKGIDETYEAIENDDESRKYTSELISRFIIPLQNNLVEESRASELVWICRIEKQIGTRMVKKGIKDLLRKILTLYEDLYSSVYQSNTIGKEYIEKYIINCCEYLRNEAPQTQEEIKLIDQYIKRMKNL